MAWATPNPERPGEYLRPRSGEVGVRNFNQHSAFLREVGEDSAKHRKYIAWFRSLPLWLDLGGLRVVHASWDQPSMDVVSRMLSADGSLTYALMVEGSRKGSAEYEAIETILKGPEVELPETPLPVGTIRPYADPVPVLFGHYWRTGPRHVDTPKSGCVDYSAGTGGPLVAYRWCGGDLTADNFVAYPAS